jgi:hypothetical protein
MQPYLVSILSTTVTPSNPSSITAIPTAIIARWRIAGVCWDWRRRIRVLEYMDLEYKVPQQKVVGYTGLEYTVPHSVSQCSEMPSLWLHILDLERSKTMLGTQQDRLDYSALVREYMILRWVRTVLVHIRNKLA